jgi:hypothetical protein
MSAGEVFKLKHRGRLSVPEQVALMRGFIDLVGEIQASGAERPHEYLRQIGVPAEEGFDVAMVAHTAAWRIYNRILRQIIESADSEQELRARLLDLLDRVRQ